MRRTKKKPGRKSLYGEPMKAISIKLGKAQRKLLRKAYREDIKKSRTRPAFGSWLRAQLVMLAHIVLTPVEFFVERNPKAPVPMKVEGANA